LLWVQEREEKSAVGLAAASARKWATELESRSEPESVRLSALLLGWEWVSSLEGGSGPG